MGGKETRVKPWTLALVRLAKVPWLYSSWELASLDVSDCEEIARQLAFEINQSAGGGPRAA